MHAAFARDNENRCKVFGCLPVLRNERSVQTVFSCRGTVGVDVTFISAAFLDVHGREPGEIRSHWLVGQRGEKKEEKDSDDMVSRILFMQILSS